VDTGFTLLEYLLDVLVAFARWWNEKWTKYKVLFLL